MSTRFRDEAKQYNFVFTCENCAQWLPEQQACSICYPSKVHRDATVAALKDGDRLFFCKMFEAD